MTQAIAATQTPFAPDRLTQRLALMDVTAAHVASDGKLTVPARARPIEWLLAESPAFAATLKNKFNALRDAPGLPLEIWPGVTFVALPTERRRRTGCDAGVPVAILLSHAMLESDQLRLLCDTAHADYQTTVSRIDKRSLLSADEVTRLATILAWMRQDAIEIDRRSSELQAISGELGESYEELSLLYKLSCSMTLNQPPAGFLLEACRELQQVVGLRWMTLQLTEDARFNALSGKTFTAGEPGVDNFALGRIGRRLLEIEPPILASVVMEDSAQIRLPALQQMVTNLLIVPIMFEGQRLGLLFGGDKLDRTQISSVDAKLVNSLANSLAIFLQNTILYEDMEAMFMGTLKALTSSIDAKDSYTLGHTERVAMLSRQLAEGMDMEPALAERVYLSGLLHDVGKIGVPEAVLTKPGALTAEEFEQIKMHPEIGARILRDIRPMQDLIPGVLYHHERWDGRGYPHRLAGDNIPLFGRIICLADSFDAMSSNRTYRDAMPHDQVLAQIQQCRGTQFDPQLADIFLSLDFAAYFEMADRHRTQLQKHCA